MGGFRLFKTVIGQPGVQSRVKPPEGNQLSVIAWRGVKVPERPVLRRADFHDGREATECEPAATDFRVRRLLAVAAGVRAPVGITHHRGPLHRDDLRPQSVFRPRNVPAPENPMRRTARICRPRHAHEIVVAATFPGDVIGRLQIHDRISIAVLADGSAVKNFVRPVFGDVFLAAVHFEPGHPQLQQFGHAVLPVLFRLGIREVNQRIIFLGGFLAGAGQRPAPGERVRFHLPLKIRSNPQEHLHVLPVEPLDGFGKIRQTVGINLEIIITVRAGTPRAVNPVNAEGNAVGFHQQHVLHELGIERPGHRRAVVIVCPLRVLVAPAPGAIHPSGRQERWPGVQSVRPHQCRRIVSRVNLRRERRPFIFNLHPVGNARAEVKPPGPVAFDEECITLRGKIKRRIDRQRRFDDHLHFLATQVHGGVEVGRPRGLLRPVHHPFHQAREVFLRPGGHGQAPFDDVPVRSRRKVNRKIVPIRLHHNAHHPPIGQVGFRLLAQTIRRLGERNDRKRCASGVGFVKQPVQFEGANPGRHCGPGGGATGEQKGRKQGRRQLKDDFSFHGHGLITAKPSPAQCRRRNFVRGL